MGRQGRAERTWLMQTEKAPQARGAWRAFDARPLDWPIWARESAIDLDLQESVLHLEFELEYLAGRVVVEQV